MGFTICFLPGWILCKECCSTREAAKDDRKKSSDNTRMIDLLSRAARSISRTKLVPVAKSRDPGNGNYPFCSSVQAIHAAQARVCLC